MSIANLHVAWAVHARTGTPVPNPVMSTLAGGAEPAVAADVVNVLVFYRPAQENSAAALRELAQCQASVAGKAVRWAGVVSGNAPAADAAALARDSGFAGPVLVDAGDALYGSLGLALHPVVVIVDRRQALAAFEPYRSVNFCAVVTAELRHVLGEIGDAELRAALEPPAATEPGGREASRSHRALAEALFRAGKHDKAAVYARRSIEADPRYASAYALLGDILRAQGDCAGALAAYDAALDLDAGYAAARDGRAGCAGGP